MRQFVFLLLSVAMLASCSDQKPAAKESKFAVLIAQYKEIDIDTFRVYSTADILSDTFKFKGVPIDTSFVKQFPERLIFNFQYEKEYYACFKFTIDSNRMGLITRTPGDFSSSVLTLLVYDNRKDSIVYFFELADTWHDAEDERIKVSWIFKDTDQLLKTLIRKTSTSIADEPNAKKIETTNYYLIDLSKNKHDTVQISEIVLADMYNNFILK